MKNRLDRLKKISLKEIWDNEAQDFTPWLAEEKNLELLSELLELTKLEAQRKGYFYKACLLNQNINYEEMILLIADTVLSSKKIQNKQLRAA